MIVLLILIVICMVLAFWYFCYYNKNGKMSSVSPPSMPLKSAQLRHYMPYSEAPLSTQPMDCSIPRPAVSFRPVDMNYTDHGSGNIIMWDSQKQNLTRDDIMQSFLSGEG